MCGNRKEEMIGKLPEKLSQYSGLHLIPLKKEKKKLKEPLHFGWQRDLYEKAKRDFHLLDSHNVGLRCGLQGDGRTVIALDVDVYSKNGLCKQTSILKKEVMQHSNGVGVFESSTCGNIVCLVDISDNKYLMGVSEKFNVINHHGMEIRLKRCQQVLPPSATICKVHSQICKPRKFLYGFSINKAEGILEWLSRLLPTIVSEKKSGESSDKTGVKHNKLTALSAMTKLGRIPALNNIMTFTDPDLSTLERNLLCRILFDLPKQYSENYTLWSRIGWALRSYSDSLSCFSVFDMFSKRSSNYGGVLKIWEQYTPKGISIGTILYYHKKDGTRFMNYGGIFKDDHIDVMQGLDASKLSVKHVNCKYVTSMEGKTTLFDCTEESLKEEAILIKSHTGSGKTCLMKDIRSTLQNHGYTVLSIVSRRTLAMAHSEALECAYYENEHLTDDYIKDLSIQLDSIDKIDYSSGKIVLLLDEVNSLIFHLKNPMEKMMKKRAAMIKKFWRIVNSASIVVAVDADLTASSANYFLKMCDKKVKLYWNEYKGTLCPVVVQDTREKMINMIVDRIRKKKPIFVCSDSFTKFEKDVVIPVKNKLNEKELEKFMFFSSVDGDRNEFKKTSSWKDRFVFTTPTIVYGIDLNYKAQVFGFYYGNTMDAMNCCQQIARIRKPTDINLYFHKKNVVPTHFSLEDFRATYEETNCKILKPLEISIQGFKTSDITSYSDFVYESEYLQHRLMNLSFHMLDILQKKGHTITSAVDSTKSSKQAISTKKLMDIRQEDMKRIYDKEYEEDDKQYDIDMCKKDVIDKRIAILRNLLTEVVYNKKTGNFHEKLSELLVNDRKFSSLLRLCMFHKHDVVSLQDKLKVSRSNDLTHYHLASSDLNKVFQAKKLIDEFGIADIYSIDFKEWMKTDREDYNVPTDIIKALDLRGKKYKSKLCNSQQYQLVTDVLYSIFGNICMEPKKLKINKKQYHIKVFEQDSLDFFINSIRE